MSFVVGEYYELLPIEEITEEMFKKMNSLVSLTSQELYKKNGRVFLESSENFLELKYVNLILAFILKKATMKMTGLFIYQIS